MIRCDETAGAEKECHPPKKSARSIFLTAAIACSRAPRLRAPTSLKVQQNTRMRGSIADLFRGSSANRFRGSNSMPHMKSCKENPRANMHIEKPNHVQRQSRTCMPSQMKPATEGRLEERNYRLLAVSSSYTQHRIQTQNKTTELM